MDSRPLSPHLQIYRWQMTSVMSILHRLTGFALLGFIFGLIAWLFTLNQGAISYTIFTDLLAMAPIKAFVFLLIISLTYYFFNGIRHLCWDIGWGMDLKDAYRSGWLVLTLTFFTSLLVWTYL
ncbi:succinate dehydrogenase, cytochrome b556 subunit [Candidatus Finniella inopinata]|uniref:Succinate dehydrogenase cytochrome b556 subunit n=1 Tax=Candidatus Finniella inopinata TaxID=1696036 RepID=A0A4V2DZT1_9PROT|nr:succinate dehydrogenase, cytochrome b556 subunit [Candidatus Finniella inopinata]RZI46137.1 succinate dehydrogenase, cytochrome b556 subunit [Candidatus Finniella inopinata]